MASKIALMEDEYSTLQEKLASCHEQILEYIESIVEQLQGLSSAGGDFYTDSISPKVDLLCEELNAAKASMGDVYSAHREIITSFLTAIGDLDTCC